MRKHRKNGGRRRRREMHGGRNDAEEGKLTHVRRIIRITKGVPE